MSDEFARALARTDLPAEATARLRAVRSVLDGDEQARVESFALVGDRPHAVIAFGDPDAADLIVYLLHGIDTDLADLAPWADAARRLCADLIRTTVMRGEPRRIATIAWFAWDSGTHASALATAHATVGAARLAIDVDRMRVRNPDAHIAVVTYSYSSTLLGELLALSMSDGIDTAFSIASAGVTAAARVAIENAIAEGSLTVYATESEKDTVAPLGRLGQHPVDPRDIRGVVVYDSDGGEVPSPAGAIVEGVPVDGHASQTSVDEHGVRRIGYFDSDAQAYLTLVARLADAVTTPL